MMKTFYITTTLPYVNADPHIGFALEIIRADVVVRSKKLQGFEVFFNTGTDEHGQKLWNDAEKAGKPIRQYVDEYAERFRGLKDLLQISNDIHFIRTTDSHHEKAAQEFWKICERNGYIYKKSYKTKYCVGCELEKTDSELVDGKCPLHPTREIELIDEENYFFKFSAFQEKLLALFENNPGFVVPDFRLNEIKAFVERGLQDFSVSRLKSKMPWGISVPGDSEQVMYVWMDALTNYISTLGWPEDSENFQNFWVNGTPTQYCGKDNLRFQAAMWQAMLMAADLPPTRQIIIDGFLTGEGGVKMSKSLGNVVNPYDVVEKYGAEALRYYVCGEVSMFEDSPASLELIGKAYNAKLANGLGNLVSRVMKMAQDNAVASAQGGPAYGWSSKEHPPKADQPMAGVARENTEDKEKFFEFINRFEIGKATDLIWQKISELDLKIQNEKPFKLVKENPEEGKKKIQELVVGLFEIAELLEPILPETSAKIKSLIKENKMPDKPLFERKD
jgi:methionyl-tRNA synthetase